MRQPQNGTKTHPLTDHAVGVLLELMNGPIPRYRLNPGVVNRLCREDLITDEDGVVAITDAGRTRYENEASARNERAAAKQ